MQHLKSKTEASLSDLDSLPLPQAWAGIGLGSAKTDMVGCCSEGLGGWWGRHLVDKP